MHDPTHNTNSQSNCLRSTPMQIDGTGRGRRGERGAGVRCGGRGRSEGIQQLANKKPKQHSIMIIPVRCFTCGKARGSLMDGCSVCLGRWVGRWIESINGTWVAAAGMGWYTARRLTCAAANRARTHTHAQVIANKYEVYVQYLKNDYKEGCVPITSMHRWMTTWNHRRMCVPLRRAHHHHRHPPAIEPPTRPQAPLFTHTPTNSHSTIKTAWPWTRWG